jgi:hypothetical protein
MLENVAPSVRLGVLDFPERERAVTAGVTINRFTEFDVHRNRCNARTQPMVLHCVAWSETEIGMGRAHLRAHRGQYARELTGSMLPTDDVAL